MNWLRRQMIGRYGHDQLSMALLGLYLLMAFAIKLSGQTQIIYLSYIPLGICLYRMLSKQIEKRRLENNKFMRLVSSLYVYFKEKRKSIENFKKYNYFTCPFCKQKLRVPRGKGKIMVTCNQCRKQFTKRT